MKKILYSLAGVAALTLGAACSQEDTLLAEGEGSISITTSVSTDVDIVSRSTDGLADNCLIWISGSKGLVRQYEGADNVPASIPLLSGHYVAEAWAGDSVSASYDKRYFKGRTEFDVTKGAKTDVAIKCTIANVVVSVNYADGIEDVLSDFTMTVGHDRGSLTLDGRDDRKGYFMMPSTDKNLTYTLTGKQIDGSPFTYTAVIEDAKPTTEYVLNVKYTPVTNEAGGAVFTIIVDNTEIKKSVEIEMIGAPTIEGYGFDMSQPIMAPQGQIGQRSVYVTSATTVSSIVLKSNAFESIPELNGNDFDIIRMTGESKDAITAAGIVMEDNTNEEGTTMIKIIFKSAFTDALTDGEYPIEISATDSRGNTATATLTFNVSDAPVQTTAVDNATIGMYGATLTGRTTKEVEAVGFRYRAVGTSQWTDVAATAASRSIAAETDFSAVVTGLNAFTEYEYCTVCTMTNGSEFVGNALTFTTLDGPQIPNAGMETWGSIDDVTTLCADMESMFWDSGNWGAKKGKTTLTSAASSPLHSGSFSAMLQTKKVLGLVIAAGNLFTGHFLDTEGMSDGVLGWGRPFSGEPKALKVWVKYTPKSVTVGSAYKGNEIAKGDMDRGIIYVALLDDSKVTYNGNSWPVIVRTADLTNYSFKKDAANVIAYGEHLFTEATAGNGLIEVTIPIDYVRQGATVSNILVVCSASQFGDYYTGGDGSTMYVDDFKLVY